MDYKKAKFDAFVLTALSKKNYKIEELILLSDAELEALPISNKIIIAIKGYRDQGGITEKEVQKQIEKILDEDTTTNISAETIEYIKNTPQQERTEDVIQDSFENTPDDNEVEIIHKISSKEDIDIIRDVLQKKELKSFANYTKLLKSEVPEAILTSVESTTLNSLIEERINEVKENSTK